MKSLALLVGAMAVTALPSIAWSQPCCAGTGAYLPGRLKIHEEALIALQLRATNGLGSLDGAGLYRPAPTETRDVELAQTLVGALRFAERGQAGVSVPFVETARRLQGRSEWGGGLGDISVAARYDFRHAGEGAGMPGWALLAGFTAPTGRAPEASRSALLTDATGTGAFQLSAGGAVEQIVGDLVFSLNLLFSARTERRVLGLREQLGPQVSGLFAVGYFFPRQVALALTASSAQSLDATVDGARLPGTGNGLTSLGLSGGVPFGETWRAQAAVTYDLPALGRNRPAGLGGTFTLVSAFH